MSLGFTAKKRVASEILVYPAKRRRARAAFRKAAISWGILPVRAREASSPKTVSRIQWRLFSIVQWFLRSVSKSSAVACWGVRLVIPYCV